MQVRYSTCRLRCSFGCFSRFKEHIKKHHPKDSLSVDEFIKLRMEVVDDLGVPESGIEDADDGGDEAPPGDDDAPPGVDDGPPGLDLPTTKPAVSSKVWVLC